MIDEWISEAPAWEALELEWMIPEDLMNWRQELMEWTDYPRSAFDIEWHSPEGWIARIALTQAGQFVADMRHSRHEACFIAEKFYRDGISGYQYEALTRQALEHFESWLAEHGTEALGDLPVPLEVTERQAAAFLEALPAFKQQAGANLELLAALIRLEQQIKARA